MRPRVREAGSGQAYARKDGFSSAADKIAVRRWDLPLIESAAERKMSLDNMSKRPSSGECNVKSEKARTWLL